MSESSELPAVYRSISVEGLLRLRGKYAGRTETSRTEWMRLFLSKRIAFIDEELLRRAREEDVA